MATEAALVEGELAPLIERLLGAASLFQGIDRDAMAGLLRRAGYRLHLAPGEDLITEGDDADALYFVERGTFEVRKRSEQGDAEGEHAIGQALPGAVLGEVALLDRGRRSATVRALEPSVALVLRMRDLEEDAQARAAHGGGTRFAEYAIVC